MEKVPFEFDFDLCINPVSASVTARARKTENGLSGMKCSWSSRGHAPESMMYLSFG